MLFTGLTPREQEVLEKVCEGLTNKQIGYYLHISVHTVGEHLKNIYLKLNVDNKIALLRRAIELHLIPPIVPKKK